MFRTALQAKSYLGLRLKMPVNSRVFIQHTQGPRFHPQFHEGKEEKRQEERRGEKWGGEKKETEGKTKKGRAEEPALKHENLSPIPITPNLRSRI